jgi:hypothetical protein
LKRKQQEDEVFSSSGSRGTHPSISIYLHLHTKVGCNSWFYREGLADPVQFLFTSVMKYPPMSVWHVGLAGDSLVILKSEVKSQEKHIKTLKKRSLWSKILEEVLCSSRNATVNLQRFK